ncbi:MAG: alpha-mannosidase [Armatimonadota bacterium]
MDTTVSAVSLNRIMQTSAEHAAYLVERIEAELAFAEGLCGLQPDKAPGWQPLIERARERVAAALGDRKLDGIAAAVEDAEAILAPIGQAAKAYTVHIAGHAHIDMNWMWSWPETVAVTIDTFATMLKLMDEYPQFHFSQSQASVYRIIEQHRPDMLEQIAARIKDGHWEVTASHWVEGDKNLAGGESLCRHLLYTRQYLQGLFGLKPEDVPVDWSPDTFGHAATVPTYLVRGGVKYLYLHRPGVQTPSKPDAFWWEGPDGARVLVRNDMKYGYNGVITPAIAQNLLGFVQFTGGKDYLYVCGVGDHGGGPTRRDLLRGLDMQSWPIFPTVAFSTTRAFYERLEKENLPVITGELNCEFTGCYTTQTLIKKANRFGESRLADAEAASALAWATGGVPYPAGDFCQGWRDTLFSHFHDILPGSGVHDTRTYTHGLYQQTMATTSAAETKALRAIAALVDTSAAGQPSLGDGPVSQVHSALGAGTGFRSFDGGFWNSEQSAGHGPRPFVVFNPTAHRRSEVIEVTIWDNAPGWQVTLKNRAFSVRCPDGTVIPAQVVVGGAYWGHDFAILSFPVEVEGLGYALYTILEDCATTADSGAWQTGTRHHCGYAPAERANEGLENELIRVELDTINGGIQRLIDKRSGTVIVENAPALEYAVERPHGMTAWSIDNTGPTEYPQMTALRRTLDGPFKAAIEVDLTVHESNFTLTYEVHAGDPRLYVGIKGVWFQRGTPQTGVPALSFALPLNLKNATGRYEIPFGAIDRAWNEGEEVPALRWAQVTGTADGKSAGCLLANDSKYGHSLDGSTLRLTLIRSSYDPDILPEIGQHEMRLAIMPFAGELPVAQAIHAGQDINHALRPVGTDVHAGTLPAEAQLVQVTGDACLSAVKKAEEGNAIIVRLFNPTEKPAVAGLTVNPALGTVKCATTVDLLERALDPCSLGTDNQPSGFTIPRRGIVSVKIELAWGTVKA